MKKRRLLYTLVIAFLVAASPAPAAQNLPADLAALRALAEQGDVARQNSLGYIYDHGLLGVTKDKAEAIKWYTKAGNQGFGAAQNNLCILHASNLKIVQGVTPPKGQPLGPIAPVDGSEEDVAGVMNWCRKAADQGYERGQRLLGLFYAKGAKGADGAEGVKPDYEEAYFWLSMGRKDAFFEEVKKQLTEERRKAVDERVREWNGRRLESGSAERSLPIPSRPLLGSVLTRPTSHVSRATLVFGRLSG